MNIYSVGPLHKYFFFNFEKQEEENTFTISILISDTVDMI